MKKSIIFAALLWATSATAQNVTVDSNGNFHAVAAASKPPIPTVYTYTDNKGKVWPVFVTEKGIPYVIRTSAKTGKEYRYYLKTEATAPK